MESDNTQSTTQFNVQSDNNDESIPLDSTDIYCPKCNKIFSLSAVETNELITHVSACNGALENQNNVQDSNGDGSIPISENNKENESFIWVRKQKDNNKFVWEKKKVSSGVGDKVLEELMMEEVVSLDFEDKRKWFRNGLELIRIPWIMGADYIRVERSKLLESSMKGISNCLLNKEVKIEFVGDEQANDAGGLMREWMSLIMKELLTPELGLFVTADTNEVSYMINPKAPNTEEILEFYEFAGKVVGKAIFERITLSVHFDHCFLRALTGRDLTLEDLKTLDTPLYKSLVFLEQTTLGGCDEFEEYFVVPERGEKVIELCEQGGKKLVNDRNKQEYIRLMVEWYGKKRIEKKISAFMNGLAACIPTETLCVFEPHELEMMFSGVPFIDIDDWEANTVYRGSYSVTHPLIGWFWGCLRAMSQEDLSLLLQYCTGSPRTPIEGFRALESNRGEFAKFCIESCEYEKDMTLITAHTCFNRIVIPLYPSEELFKSHLLAAIKADFAGVFGLQ